MSGATVKQAKLQTPIKVGTTTVSTIAYAEIKNTTTNTTTTVILYPGSDITTAQAGGKLTLDGGKTIDLNDTAKVKVLFDGNGKPTDNALFTTLYGDKIAPGDIQTAKVGTDGTLTVTKRTVTNSAILSFSGKDGKFQTNGSTGGENGATMDLTSLGKAFTNVSVDFSKAVVTDNSGKSTISLEKGDKNDKNAGRESGALQGVSIQTNGMIYASYTNGQKRLLGQIAVTEFANASGLQKEGDNLYSSTKNSGDFNGIGIDITENGDAMNTGVLEMSNVDLSSEFTDMITTQRGFQANSRIITVSDTLLEELVNLKR